MQLRSNRLFDTDGRRRDRLLVLLQESGGRAATQTDGDGHVANCDRLQLLRLLCIIIV